MRVDLAPPRAETVADAGDDIMAGGSSPFLDFLDVLARHPSRALVSVAALFHKVFGAQVENNPFLNYPKLSKIFRSVAAAPLKR